MTDHDPRDPDPADPSDPVDDPPAAEHPPTPPPSDDQPEPVDPPTDNPPPADASVAAGQPPGRRAMAWVGAAALALVAFFGGRAVGHANDDDGPRRGDWHEGGPSAGWHDEDRRPPMPPERGVERR